MKERMLRGELYVVDDAELGADHARAQALLERYNRTAHAEHDERGRLLREANRSRSATTSGWAAA